MNALERSECLLDAGSSGNMNSTVIASYRGRLEPAGLQSALAALQGKHQLLRSTLQWQGVHCRFTPTAATFPVTVLPWPGDGDGDQEGDRDAVAASLAWKPATMAALRQFFVGGGEPFWRLSWLRGAAAGELLLTFHHAIADGLSAMALVQRLFSLLAALEAGASPCPQRIGMPSRRISVAPFLAQPLIRKLPPRLPLR